ncbi:hypothetical protein JCM8547_007448 [Rhodosporidiobolus lusitaniae]
MAFSFAPVPTGTAPAAPAAFAFSSSSLNTSTLQQPAQEVAKGAHKHKHTMLESRAFLTQSYTTWASLQKIVDEYESTAPLSGFRIGRNVPEPPPPEQVQYYGRVCQLYRESLAQQLPLIKADPSLSPAQKTKSLEHHVTMHAILSLAEILYFPLDGRGEGLVGEEILDWVNTVDRAPSAEEGAELSSLAAPWDSPNFFPYLYRCILRGHLSSSSALLTVIFTSHPSPYLKSLSSTFANLLETFPRSPSFRTEAAFLSALRNWKSTLASSSRTIESLFSSASSDPILGGSDSADERSEWESGFKALLDLLSGRESRILEIAEDWREAMAAWGLWVNPGGLRREDLPVVVELVTKELPFDSTLEDEVAQHALLQGDAADVLKAVTQPYPWLATHLADLLSHLHLPAFDTPVSASSNALMDEHGAAKKGGAEEEDALPLSLREHFLLDWGTRLSTATDTSLWRLACEYWGACGAEGRKRARTLLRSLRLDEGEVLVAAEGEKEKEPREDGMDVEGGEGEKSKKEKKVSRVEEVLTVCADLGLEEEMVSICKSYASQLVARKRYGEAIAFSVRAADSRRIAEIANLILDEYIENGQDAFISHVDSIPTSLLRPSASPSSMPGSPSSSTASDDLDPYLPHSTPSALAPYSSRLSFLARYRDFFALYASGSRREAAALLVLMLTSGVAPKRVWGVMLLDALPLLETSLPLVSLSETFDLLRILEDVVGPVVAQTPPRDVFGNLEALGRLASKEGKKAVGKEGEEERTARALEQMEVVRGALARHLALCSCLE